MHIKAIYAKYNVRVGYWASKIQNLHHSDINVQLKFCEELATSFEGKYVANCEVTFRPSIPGSTR
jgi:hypothetical protein